MPKGYDIDDPEYKDVDDNYSVYSTRYLIYKMCKLTRQSEKHIKENYTTAEATLFMCFEMYDAYNMERQMKKK